jgi:peptide/nickel transport system permease protein
VLSFIARRVALGLFTIWMISVLSFVIIQLPPGDVVTARQARLIEQGNESAIGQADELREELGLNDPLPVQYVTWMGRVVHGDFGMSFDWNRPVRDVIGERLPLTVVVSVAAILFTFTLALPIGIYSAVRRYSIGDHFFTLFGFIGLAVPNFLLALVLMYIASRYFGWSVGGLFSSEYETAGWSLGKVTDLLKHLPVPAIVLGMAGTADLIRVMRANLLDEVRKPYVVAARAKGLPERRLIGKYPVRVALNPFGSTIGFLLPTIVGGAVIVDYVLGLPTLGPVLLQSLLSQDMLLAGTIVLLLGVMTVIGTLISDIVLMWLDPRIRLHD